MHRCIRACMVIFHGGRCRDREGVGGSGQGLTVGGFGSENGVLWWV